MSSREFLWPELVASVGCRAGKLGEYHAYEPALLAASGGQASGAQAAGEGPGALAAKSSSRAGDVRTPRDSRASWQRR